MYFYLHLYLSPGYSCICICLLGIHVFLSVFVFVSWVFMCGLPPPAAACLSIDPEVITKRPTLPHSDHLLLQDIVLFVFVYVFVFYLK